MKRNQSGFTLIEIAIVLVIIGLLLGGVLKGQELINSAKVKNLASDFKNVPLYIYGYQDKFKALPGDDTLAVTHASGVVATTPAGTTGNGLINGEWNSNTVTHESILFWQHVRLAGLVAGQTNAPSSIANDQDPYLPQNAVGGRVGVESGSTVPPIVNLKGAYIVCSSHILGKFAKQLDTTMDDGVPSTGSVMVTADTTGSTTARASSATAITNAGSVEDAVLYTVCMGV
jgi:prepilin-type N-terminal cleavage/methylation domain-containing protein